VSAKDLGTGRVQQVRVVSNSGLSEQEIQRMINDAQTNASDDKKKKELADLRNNADGLVYTTEKSVEEYANLLTQKDRDEIKTDLEALKKVLDSTDPATLKAALQRLEGSAYRIADVIYSSEQQKPET
jgi:molecular chaperone DnaK